jgi:hypothetical protein
MIKVFLLNACDAGREGEFADVFRRASPYGHVDFKLGPSPLGAG